MAAFILGLWHGQMTPWNSGRIIGGTLIAALKRTVCCDFVGWGLVFAVVLFLRRLMTGQRMGAFRRDVRNRVS
jgi:hypothetical protein